jgi:sphingomyelin phosphodiesterase
MNNDCGKPICCRSDSGLPKNKSNAAGKWGDELCDIPERTMVSLLDYINDEIQPDVALWGGDSIPHNVDSITEKDNIAIMKNVSAQVRESIKNVRIYPTLGNHDTYP